MTTITNPPEFMPPSPYQPAEGYWADMESKDRNRYMPIISKKVWKDKLKFLQALERIEGSMPRYIWSPDTRQEFYNVSFRGLAYSRIDGTGVGNSEFVDLEKDIKWPQGYAQHYIGKHNVMPTKRFFEYVMYRIKNPFLAASALPQTQRPTTPKPASAPKKCPMGKIRNPATNRCVLRTGKVGQRILAGRGQRKAKKE